MSTTTPAPAPLSAARPGVAEVKRAAAVGHLESALAEIDRARAALGAAGDLRACSLAYQGRERVVTALAALGHPA